MHLLFKEIKESDKNIAINSLINDSTPKPSFFFLIILSVLMATLGLILNNVSIIIASMLIAPILSPILAIALGISVSDNDTIKKSLITLGKAILYAIGISTITTIVFWKAIKLGDVLNPEIISRTQPNIIYFIIAIVAGLTTTFSRMKPELNETLPGTAIAIALVPPLSTIGIGIATLNIHIISGALSMFVLNILGIILASLVIFSLMNIRSKKKTVIRAKANSEEDFEKIKEDFEIDQLEKQIKQEKITYNMQLSIDSFNKIKSKKKTIEIILKNKKLQKLKRNDIIIFSKKVDPNNKIIVKIVNIIEYDNFIDLLKNTNIKDLGYEDNYNKEKILKSLYEIYTEDQEKENKILAIYIKNLKINEKEKI